MSNSRAPLYLVLPRTGGPTGGAEKRFTQLWCSLQRANPETRSYDPYLVIEDKLLATLMRGAEFPELATRRELIIAVDGSALSPRRFPRFAKERIREDARSAFHCVMIGPAASRSVGKRTLFSIAAARMSFFNTVGKIEIYADVFNSALVEMLDATVHAHMAKLMPWKRDAMSITSNTAIDLSYYTPGPFEERRDRLVFLGTFLKLKGTYRLLERLPEIDRRLKEAGIAHPEWVFIGRDSVNQGEPVGEVCARLREQGIDVRAFYSDDPRTELRSAKVFFSLQTRENYPSKSLVEALASGVQTIITDVGQSRRMATEDFAAFIPGEYSATEMFERCYAALTLDRAAYDARVAKARAFVEEKFSEKNMAAYYSRLHERLVAQSATIGSRGSSRSSARVSPTR